jgi:hypothetical protein
MMKNFDRFEGNRDKPNTSVRRASRTTKNDFVFVARAVFLSTHKEPYDEEPVP